MKKGFTLIELLVGVIIVGILAAIAYPQYEKAVEKARFAEGITLLRAIGEANNAYYMANGKYAKLIDDLDLKVGKQVSPGNIYYSTKWFWVAASWDGQGNAASANRTPMWQGYRLSLSKNGTITCICSDPSMTEKQQKMAEYICSSFGVSQGISGWCSYIIQKGK